MGFNTWNAFHCDIDEQSVKDNVDLIIRLGLRDAGYTFFNLDDCWQLRERSADGSLQPDSSRFPNGIKALADYVHSKGMQFGIYSDAGLYTCEGRAGSLGHETADAAIFASWGVDYLKYDNCFSPPLAKVDVRSRYSAMRDALNSTGRPIVFSMCEWGVNEPHLWGGRTGNLWRTANDISANWDSVLRSLDNQVGLAMYAGPGGWNDPDMLEVGNFGNYPLEHQGLSLGRQRAHFALWALMKAPLLIGTDLRAIKQAALDVLLAKEVIAVNQDPLGVAGDLIYTQGPAQVFASPLAGGCRAVAFFHRTRDGQPINITVTWPMLGYPGDLPALTRNLYDEQDIGTFSDSLQVTVAADSVVLVKLTPQPATHAHGVLAPLNAAVRAVRAAVSSRHARPLGGDATLLQQGRLEAEPVPTLLESLDSWRPWDHGFFGHKESDAWDAREAVFA